jgi:hypothetical protein
VHVRTAGHNKLMKTVMFLNAGWQEDADTLCYFEDESSRREIVLELFVNVMRKAGRTGEIRSASTEERNAGFCYFRWPLDRDGGNSRLLIWNSGLVNMSGCISSHWQVLDIVVKKLFKDRLHDLGREYLLLGNCLPIPAVAIRPPEALLGRWVMSA